jgi:SAM-dependent methyltransferase
VDYGDYVLSAEADPYVANWETSMGRYLYETRFAGRRPILEIGPGRCWFTRQAPDDIVALELDAGLVAKYQSKGLDIRQGSIYELPFEDEFFDGAFCCWVFEHLHEPARAATEIRRVLRPGSPLCLIVPSERQVGRGFQDS